MSFRLVDLIFDVDDLSIWEFTVLSAIARTADNKDFTCYPSVETIARYAHASLRQVQRTLPLLIKRGLITRTTQAQGRGNKSLFHVHVENIRTLRDKGAQQTPITEIEGDTDDTDTDEGKDAPQAPILGTPNMTLTPLKGAP
jgi:hypothetical protein